MVSATASVTFSEKLEDAGSQQITKQEMWLHLCKQLPGLLGTVPFAFFTGTKGKCLTHGKDFIIFFYNDKICSNLKGNGDFYFDYFQCTDIVLL